MNLSFFWIVFAGVCWGLDGLLRSKIVGLSPLVIVTLEHSIAFIILAIIGIKHLKFPKLTTRAWCALIGVAFFSGLVGTYAFTWAMMHVHYSSFGVLFLMLKLQPIFAITAALIFLGESPKKSFYPLALLAMIAAYFVSFGKQGMHLPDAGSDVMKAVCAALVAAVCWGSATVFSRYLSHQGYKSRTMTAYRLGMVAILGVIALGILSLFGIEKVSFLAFSFQPLAFIVGVALLSGVLATTMYYRGIKNTKAALASIFELSLPLTGFIIDIVYHHKTFDQVQIVAAVCLLVIMYMISYTSRHSA